MAVLSGFRSTTLGCAGQMFWLFNLVSPADSPLKYLHIFLVDWHEIWFRLSCSHRRNWLNFGDAVTYFISIIIIWFVTKYLQDYRHFHQLCLVLIRKRWCVCRVLAVSSCRPRAPVMAAQITPCPWGNEWCFFKATSLHMKSVFFRSCWTQTSYFSKWNAQQTCTFEWQE